MVFNNNLVIYDDNYYKYLQENNIYDAYSLFRYINRNLENKDFPLLSKFFNENYVFISDLNKFLKNECNNKIFYYWKSAIKDGVLRKIIRKEKPILEIIQKKPFPNIKDKYILIDNNPCVQ